MKTDQTIPPDYITDYNYSRVALGLKSHHYGEVFKSGIHT